MKKVGIMSMQRIVNYGSFLQAYGLKKTIESLNFKVEFVDFKKEKAIVNNDYRRIVTKISKYIIVSNLIKQKKFQHNFTKSYKRYIKKYLGIDDQMNYAYNNVDKLIIGSDEVFNCLQDSNIGYSRELFGKNYEDIPVISYAASFGSATINRIIEYNIFDELSKMLKRFKGISVRDQNSFEIVKSLTEISPSINLDPVLVYDFTNEERDNVKIDNYILLYAYNNRLTRKEEKYIKKFARKKNRKIVTIGMYQKIANINLIVEPFEVFAYFRHADFIITDTFHGSIFSIKTHSKFATIIRNSNKNKLFDLLERLDKTECIINNINEIDDLYEKNLDYNNTDKIIKANKKITIEYLKGNLIK